MADIKWSAFPNVGSIQSGDILVGLRSGINVQINAPTFGSQIVVVNTPSQAMVTNTIYIINDQLSLVTLALPTISAVGDRLSIVGISPDLWTITQIANQQIFVSPQHTTLGATGTLSSSGAYDSINLICIGTNTIWSAIGAPQSTGLIFV